MGLSDAVVKESRDRRVKTAIENDGLKRSNAVVGSKRAYNPLRKSGFNHLRVSHGAREYVRGQVHTNVRKREERKRR